MLKIYYLGPEGSNTHLAATKFAQNIKDEISFVSVYNIQQGFDDYNRENDNAVLILPLENSIEGTVRETIDNLIFQKNENLKICNVITLDIKHCLISDKKAELSDIKTITSHPQAISQCIDAIYELFGNDVKIVNTTSTSTATKSLVVNDCTVASIANELCAKIYDKKILKTNISKSDNNKTRFAVITKYNQKLLSDISSKVAIAFSTKNISGALACVLDVLAYYKINLSHIESRPSKLQLGEYVFYCELDTNFENNNLEIALNKIKNYTNYLRINGEFASI